MTEISSTVAAKSLSSVLDHVEHRSEQFTVVRHGRAVARIVPISGGIGRDVKEALTRHPPDADWMTDLSEIRSLLQAERM